LLHACALSCFFLSFSRFSSCFILHQLGLTLQWALNKRWYLGVYNLGFASAVVFELFLGIICSITLHRTLTKFMTESKLSDISHIQQSVRTLSIFFMWCIPPGSGIIGKHIPRLYSKWKYLSCASYVLGFRPAVVARLCPFYRIEI
jgi:hypothetical protein